MTMLKPHRPSDLAHLLAIQPNSIFHPWLSSASLTLLFAGRGIGKTFLGLHLATSLASNSPFLAWTPQSQPRILYIDGEMGMSALAKRIDSISPNFLSSDAAYRKLSILTCDDFPNGELPNISAPAAQISYSNTIKDQDAEIIIIDNLLTASAPISPHDDDASQWRRIQPWLVNLRSQNRAVILIHHAGKSGDQLGTSMRENIMDTVIHLKSTRLKNAIHGTPLEWHFTKSRHFFGPDASPLFIEITQSSTGLNFYHAPLETIQKTQIIFLWEKTRNINIITGALDLPNWLVRQTVDAYKSTPYTPQEPQDSDDLW